MREDFVVRDYTRLKNRQNRLYEWAGMALPGLVMHQLGVAAAFFGVVLVMGILVGIVLSSSIAFLFAVALAAVAAIAGYLFVGVVDVSRLSIKDQILVALDYTFIQPKTITGFEADKEADQYRWLVEMWEPTSREWVDTYHTLLAYYETPKTESAQR